MKTKKYLAALLIAGAMSANVISYPTMLPPQLLSVPITVNAAYETELSQLIELVNNARTQNGLAPVTRSPKLMECAAIRARELTTNFSDERSDGSPGLMTLVEKGVDFDSAQENLSMGYNTPSEVMSIWMGGGSERECILSSEFHFIGAGVAEQNGVLYWEICLTDKTGESISTQPAETTTTTPETTTTTTTTTETTTTTTTTTTTETTTTTTTTTTTETTTTTTTSTTPETTTTTTTSTTPETTTTTTTSTTPETTTTTTTSTTPETTTTTTTSTTPETTTTTTTSTTPETTTTTTTSTTPETTTTTTTSTTPETTTTTTTSTTPETTATTTSTTPETKVIPILGDVDENTVIDAVDASKILIEAANTGAGNPSILNDNQRNRGDIDRNWVTDAADAAKILQYAAYSGTGGTQTIEEYFNIKL